MIDTASRSAYRPGRRVAALLVHVLVLLLVPVLIIATPQTARAATVFGDKVSGSFDLDGSLAGDWLRCNFVAYWVVPPSGNVLNQPHVNIPSLKCQAGWWVEGGDVALTMTVSGQGCTATGTSAGSGFAVENASVTLPGDTFYVPTACDVQTLCVSGTVENNNFPNASLGEEQCIPLPVGVAPAGTGSTCAEGGPTRAQLVSYRTTGSGAQTFPTITVWFAGVVDGKQWMVVPIVEGINGNPALSALNAATYPVNGGSMTFESNSAVATSSFTSNPANYGRLVGIQVHPYYMPWGGTGTAPMNRSDLNQNRTLATDGGTGYMGATDVSKCRYYIGRKIANTSDTTDEPHSTEIYGPGTTPTEPISEPPADDAPPPASSEACTFSWSDPATWATGGICALVKLFGRAVGLLVDVVDELIGLPAKLVGLLAGLLEDLFVPGPGYDFAVSDSGVEDEVMTGGVGEWRDLFASAPGGSAAAGGSTGMGAMRVVDPGDGGAGGGCQGPTFPLPEFMTNAGMPAQLAPLEACDGTMATLASWTRLIAMVLMGVTCLVKCMEMITASAGIMRQTSIMSSYDWSNATTVIKR